MTVKHNLIGFWALLIASVVALALIAILLIRSENNRQAEADATLLSEETQRLQSRLQSYFEQIKFETARQLIAFHDEGLSNQLRRWSLNNPLIHSAGINVPGTQADQHFLNTNDLIHLDAPETPKTLGSGYYEENREIAVYETGSADPVISWQFSQNGAIGQWQLAHRLAPNQPVRYALLNTDELINSFETLLAEFTSPNLHASIEKSPTNSQRSDSISISDIVPDFLLHVRFSTNEARGQWLSHFGYAMVALCIGLCLTCATLLARKISREQREALRKTNFVTQISHEFKTPLTNITLYADLLSNSNLPTEKRERYLETIGRESLRLTDMVDNLLALSALEQNKKHYKIEGLDLNAALTSIVEDYRDVFETSGITIHWNSAEVDAQAEIDSAVFRQTMLNLLDNARKYAREGRNVTIDLIQENQYWNVSVSDNGPGIPKDIAGQIFEAFFQENALLTEKSAGAGLGLNVSRRMLRDCHCDLYLDSSYEHGARFIIQIPRSKQHRHSPILEV